MISSKLQCCIFTKTSLRARRSFDESLQISKNIVHTVGVASQSREWQWIVNSHLIIAAGSLGKVPLGKYGSVRPPEVNHLPLITLRWLLKSSRILNMNLPQKLIFWKDLTTSTWNIQNHLSCAYSIDSLLFFSIIVRYLDSFLSNTGALCIVMEFCDRGSLATFDMDKSEDNVWRFIAHMSSALTYIHSKGIIHRDIKPENILGKSNSNGLIDMKLADFGISKLLNKQHYGQFYARSCIGTAIYMSPEALDSHLGNRYGFASDIWSLGAVISFFCNRRHVFQSVLAVRAWPGGRSSLDRSKYSLNLRQMTADMMHPLDTMRPTAEMIKAKSFPLQKWWNDNQTYTL